MGWASMLQSERYTGSLDSAALVDEFLDDCSGLADATKASYRWALERLVSECPELPQTRRGLRPVFDMPKPNGEPLQPESQRHLRRVLRIFYRWCWNEYALPNAAEQLRPIAPNAPPIRWLSEHEIDHLLAVAGGVDRITRDYSVKQNRDRALVATLANTGARVGEIAALKPADIQPGKLSVRGKTGYRALTISPNVEDLIRRQVSGGIVWASMRGGELTCSGIQLIVGRLIRKAGVKGHRLGPHTLRHSFATNFVLKSLNEGRDGDIDHLRFLMGHKRRDQTLRYVQVAEEEVAAQAHAKFAPFADRGLL